MTIEVLAGVFVVALVAAVAAWAIVGGKRRGKARKPPYLVALGAMVDGDEEAALAALKETVRADSSNVDAYLRLGDLFRRRGDAERAYQLHRELASRPGLPREDLARVHLALSRDHTTLDRPQRAVEAAREAARLASDPEDALQELVRVQERLGDRAGAFQTKKELLRRTGRSRSGGEELADYRAQQGEAFLEEGHLKEAERALKEARRLHAASHRSRRAWGKLRERLGDYDGAVEAWEALLEDPELVDEGVFPDLERVRFLDGTFSEMEDTYNRFLETTPRHEAASFGLARFLRRKGQLDSALEVCRRGLSAHPDSLNLRVLQLALLLQAERTGEAEAELNEWISQSLGESRPEGAESPLEIETQP